MCLEYGPSHSKDLVRFISMGLWGFSLAGKYLNQNLSPNEKHKESIRKTEKGFKS